MTIKVKDNGPSEQEVVEACIARYGSMPMWAEAREDEAQGEFLGYADTYERFVEVFGSASEPKRPRARREIDNSPEAKAARALFAKRSAEALEYVRTYTGSWGLPLDIRADRRFGTSHMKLTDRQVEALLAGKARDEAKHTERDAWSTEHADVVTWLTLHAKSSFLSDMLAAITRFGSLTDRQLEAVRRSMTESTTGPKVTEGMYRDPEGNIFKVQHTREDHARLYAKRLVTEGRHGTFEYWPGGIRQLRPEWHMTVEEAAEFGKLYGFCCVCGRELTDEQSVAAGIGPVCASSILWRTEKV